MKLAVRKLEEQAALLLEESGTSTLPTDLGAVAAHLNLSIEYPSLGEEVSGVLVITEDGGTIGVNIANPPKRQRFSIAHEIGHLFIDKKYVAMFRDSKSSSGEHEQEIEANRFAAALLMPEARVREAVANMHFDLGDEDALESLSSLFDVSAQAMSFRLQNLQIFIS